MSGRPASDAAPLAESLLGVWDAVPEALVALDADWTYRYLNPAALELLGLTSDVVGLDYRKVHPELPGSGFDVVHQRVMRTREPETFESYYEPLDTYLRVRVLPWPGCGLVLSIRDVTEERRPQTRLRRNLDLYRQVVEHMTQAITLRDIDGRFLLVNEAAANRLGRSVEDLVGSTVQEVLQPDIARITLEVDAQVLATGEAQDNPAVHLLHPDRTVLARVFPVRGDDGLVMGIVTTVLDITELTATQAELTASQLRFRRVFASTSLGVLVTRETGEIVEVNSALCRLLGWSRSALLSMRGPDLLAPAGDDGDLSRRWIRGEGDADYEVEDELVRSDGTAVPVLLTINTFQDAEGRGLLISCVVRDLTTVRQLQQQLVEAERLEALGWLAAGVAHDANNILTAVSGYAELLREELASHPDAQRHLEGIFRSVDRAADMVSRLLALTGDQPVEPTAVDLADLVSDLEDMLRQLLPVGVSLELELEPAPVRVDVSQIRRVLLNLVINAQQALGRSGTIWVRTGRCAGDAAVLSVADDGPGMPDDVAEHCFEPFFTTRQGRGGTGVGLSTAHDIAVQHRGELRVSTALGQGTVFDLVLPLAPSAAAPRSGGPSTGARVVVADDDAVVRQLMISVLEAAGYVVVGAEDGIAALALAPGAHLVVSDVDMPGMNGLELAEQLELREPSTPVLLVSGNPAPRVSPGVPFLAKPFSGMALVDAVDAALRGTP